MDKLIDIVERAVADYGFRQAVLYGAEDVARRWELSDQEKSLLNGLVIEMLAGLPNPVEPDNLPVEQARLAQVIRDSVSG